MTNAGESAPISGRNAAPCGAAATTVYRTLLNLGIVPAALSSAVCMALLAARWVYLEEPGFTFLVWNLFLAWLPWLFSVPLAAIPSRRGEAWKLLPAFAAWLLFLPNAPYLVTDLLHLRQRAGVPLWFDATVFFTFAWTGCLLGFLSLTAVHARIEAWLGRSAGWLFVGVVSLLTGFGIYLGRFPRWNSWDLFTRPEQLLPAVVAPLRDPFAHPDTWAVTLLFGLLMIAGYTAFAGRREARVTRFP